MADRAYDVCCLTMDIYGVQRLHMPTWAKGIRGNTLGVIKKVLGVEFQSQAEMMQYYSTDNTN